MSLEQKVEELLKMGYEQVDAEKALKDSHGNLQDAIEILVSKSSIQKES